MVAATTGWAAPNCSAAAARSTPWRGGHPAQALAQRVLFRAGRQVIVMIAAGQKARVIRPAQHHGRAAPGAQREELRQRGRLHQRVAAGEQENVGVGLLQRAQAGLDRVDAHAPALDQAFLAHPDQALEGAVLARGDAEMMLEFGTRERIKREVVDVDDVDVAEREALQAVFDRAARAVGRVIDDAPEGQGGDEGSGDLARRVGHQQAADLGRERVVLARTTAQRLSEPVFGEAGAIVRRGVEVADAGVPCGVHGRQCCFFAGGVIHVAQPGAAEAQVRDRSVALVHDASFWFMEELP